MRKEDAMKQMHDIMRLQRKSRGTIKAYLEWLGRYADFLATCTAETHEDKVGAFLSRLVNGSNVSISTQKQALCALVYFYRHVAKIPLGDLSFCHARRIARLPEVFSRQEAWRVLDRLDGLGWLWGAFMYGCGLRLDECCSLRVKDVDIDRRIVVVREGKGGKDRTVPLPELLVEPLQKHLRTLEDRHARDSAARIAVALPDRLDRKYPAAPHAWEWYWLFPAEGPAKDPQWEGKLCHVHPSAVQKRIRRAILAARIAKKAGCHTFRHSYATHWLENAEGSHDVALKRLQDLMGHKDVKTTMVYLHLIQQKTDVISPLDSRTAGATP